MKKILKITLAVALVSMGFSTGAFAQKFGYVNRDALVQSMPEMDSVQKKIEAYSKEMQETFNTMQEEYTKKVTDYYNQHPDSLSEAVRQVKEDEMRSLQERLTQFRDSFPQNQQQEWQRLIQPVLVKADEAINKVSKEGGFAVVFDTSSGALAYFDQAALTDITPLAQKELGVTPK